MSRGWGGATLPTVGQVERDAASDVGTEAHVSHGSQADVEQGHRAHSQVQHQQEAFGLLHLVLQGKNLPETGKDPPPTGQTWSLVFCCSSQRKTETSIRAGSF